MKHLVEIERRVYGHDATAINLHSDRKYQDEKGQFYLLSRTLDGVPPFFEAYGPYTADYVGALPHLRVNDQEYWGDGWSWRKAVKAFLKEIGAVLQARPARDKRCADG